MSIHYLLCAIPIIQHAMQMHDMQTCSDVPIQDLTFLSLYWITAITSVRAIDLKHRTTITIMYVVGALLRSRFLSSSPLALNGRPHCLPSGCLRIFNPRVRSPIYFQHGKDPTSKSHLKYLLIFMTQPTFEESAQCLCHACIHTPRLKFHAPLYFNFNFQCNFSLMQFPWHYLATRK